MSNLIRFIGEAGFLLPHEAVDLLIEEYPKSYRGLTRHEIPNDLALKLASKKLDSETARNFYYYQSAEVLAQLVVKERRLGPLKLMLYRMNVGADLQSKLCNRKLHTDIISDLIQKGLTLQASEKLWRKNTLTVEQRIAILEAHGNNLPADMVAEGIVAARDYPVFAGWWASKRPDARSILLCQGYPNSFGVLSSITLTTTEQRELVRLLGNYQSTYVATAAALLDNPTTTLALREVLWDKYQKAFTTLGWPVSTPDMWPEVTSLRDLDEVTRRRLLQRDVSPPWDVTRALQVIELLLMDDELSFLCWHQIEKAIAPTRRRGVGLGWLVDMPGKIPDSAISMFYAADEAVANFNDQQGRIAACVDFSGLRCASPPQPVTPITANPNGDLKPSEVSPYQYSDNIRSIVAYLVQELGTDRHAWRVAFGLIGSFPGTTAELAKAALASSH